MIDFVLRLTLVGWVVVTILLSLPRPVALATVGLAEQPPDAQRDFLLAKKADEWEILRDLGQLTKAPAGRFTPTYPDQPFVQQADGTVLLADQHYRRYVQVSSADELTAALTKAEAGDFIHLEDGTYAGNFVISRSGLADQPIALYGSRQAILDGQTIKRGYGLHLQADHWRLLGFTIRNAAKGLMTDGANHNLISGLELYQIGDEGLHLRRASSDNHIEQLWIHDVGLVNPEFGEGIYIGSAHSNWATYSGGGPDRSDRNRVIGNVLGPGVTAEGIDSKEGTTGGLLQNNTFITDEKLLADSWIDLKGNDYVVTDNLGSYQADSPWRMAVDVLQLAAGWGQQNTIAGNQEFTHKALPTPPFFVPPPTVANHGRDSFTRSAYLILPARLLPYTLSELIAYFPASVAAFGTQTTLLRENLLVGRNATLWITTSDTHRVRLLSTPDRFVTINGFLANLKLQGSPEQRLDFEAWDVAQAKADTERQDGRAYVLAAAGRMDITHAGFFDLGYEEGTVSGVSWKSVGIDGGLVLSYGNVSHSHFVRNYFGA
ncbi:MAG: right-handed parallel beta-helix repeat-containing protein, partial [Caldilineaceae bacterium]